MTVIDSEGVNLGVLKTEDALKIAKEKDLDLIIVSKSGEKAVARIIDIAKLKYEKSKKQKKNKGKNVQNKEIWFKPNIQERDLQLKLNKAKEFLEKGGNVKLLLKADRKVPYNIMNDVMNKIVENAIVFSKPINTLTREGRNMSITIKALK